VDQHVAAFLSRLPAPVREPHRLRDDLSALLARARAESPGIELDAADFLGHVAERVMLDGQGTPLLRALYAGDLWLAYGCIVDNRAALALFEERFAPEIKGALARSFDAGLAEDAELKLRNKLFLVGEHDHPRLASYAGRGALGPWLRAAAARTAIDLMRTRRELPAEPGALADLASFDPLLAQLKTRYREEFRAAFRDAAAGLADRELTILRYKFVENLSIDEIGVIYGVHRATVARWIAAIREALFDGTRKQLADRLAIAPAEIDSVLRLIDSQIDISIEAIVR
jgi:RNA polymerase sigma-70 factor (ECF subfamily)